MGSRVSAYAYLNTRVSLMAEQLLHRKQREALLELPLSEMQPLLNQAGLQKISQEQDLLDLGELASLNQQVLINTDSVEEFLRQLKSSSYSNMASPARKAQACLRPRDRFWDIPVPKIDSAFDNLLVPQTSWSPSTTQQLRKLVAAPYLPPNDWTPRLDTYFASPLALCARWVSSAASRLLGSTSLRFALHGWQRMKQLPPALYQQLADTDNIAEIEQHMQQLVRTLANRILRKQRFNMARAYAYLYLREQQIQLIHAVLKGHLLGLSPELIQFCGDPLAHPALARREQP